MNEEIMTNVNEEAIEAVEEQMTKGSGLGWKIGLGAAVGAGAVYLLATKVVKPMINKIKAKKESKKAQEELEVEEFDTDDFKLD